MGAQRRSSLTLLLDCSKSFFFFFFARWPLISQFWPLVLGKKMRVKKQKQLRRHVRFYKTCFGFREPFKVLCDGTFVHYCLTQKIGSLQDSLSTILGAPAKPMVTRYLHCLHLLSFSPHPLTMIWIPWRFCREFLFGGSFVIEIDILWWLHTRCVIAELKKLGETYSGTALAARRLNLAKYVPQSLRSHLRVFHD